MSENNFTENLAIALFASFLTASIVLTITAWNKLVEGTNPNIYGLSGAILCILALITLRIHVKEDVSKFIWAVIGTYAFLSLILAIIVVFGWTHT